MLHSQTKKDTLNHSIESTSIDEEEKLKKLLGFQNSPSDHCIALFQRAMSYCSPLHHLTGIEMIAICNSLSMYCADDESDIDLFIVTKPGRLWTMRIFVTAYFQLLGVRRHGNKVRGRFCLSFFATKDGLNLSSIALKPRDSYLELWAKNLKPIVNRNRTYEEFLAANQDWIPTITSNLQENTRFLDKSNLIEDRKNGNLFSRWNTGRLLECLLRSIFLPITEKTYSSLGKPWGVIISDTYLKFHPRDRRKELQEMIHSN